jgi:hypothetical protein
VPRERSGRRRRRLRACPVATRSAPARRNSPRGCGTSSPSGMNLHDVVRRRRRRRRREPRIHGVQTVPESGDCCRRVEVRTRDRPAHRAAAEVRGELHDADLVVRVLPRLWSPRRR